MSAQRRKVHFHWNHRPGISMQVWVYAGVDARCSGESKRVGLTSLRAIHATNGSCVVICFRSQPLLAAVCKSPRIAARISPEDGFPLAKFGSSVIRQKARLNS